MMVPSNYSQWVILLESFKNKINDEDVLPAMQQGTLAWQSGISERFAKKLIDAVNCRMNMASDKFQKDMLHMQGQERELIKALLLLRKEMSFLAEAVNLPVLPEQERTDYVKLVKAQADNIQNSLEDSARKDRTGKLASIVRNHKINAF